MNDRNLKRLPSVGFWGLSLGAIGFCAGFFGPILLNPGANQGPLLGILITGPSGLIGGLILGTVCRFLPISNAQRGRLLLGANALLLLGILYFCLPPPETHGYLIKATLIRCQSPKELGAESIRYWEDRIAGAPWAKARDGWQAELPGLIAREPGVVLTILTKREAQVVRHRKPWNRGRIATQDWQSRDEERRYFANFDGTACQDYPTALPTLFVPYGQGSSTWPPDDLAGMLHLARIERAPQPLKPH